MDRIHTFLKARRCAKATSFQLSDYHYTEPSLRNALSHLSFVYFCLHFLGKVYVHCRMGISRSATLVLAYLIMKRGLSAQEAVRTVRKHREIIPNQGFLKQLCELNELVLKKKAETDSVHKHLPGTF